MSEIEAKYFITCDYNKTGQNLDKKITEKGLVDKSNISRFTDNSDLVKHNITSDNNISNKQRIKSRARFNKETSSV